jgi:TPR repeat protein
MTAGGSWGGGLVLALVLYASPKDYAACLRKDGSACWRAARHYLPDGPDAPVDLDKATHFLRLGCEGAASAGACAELANVYAGQYGGPVDTARAVTLYERACQGGDAIACYFGGQLYESGVGIPADASKAAALYLRGCGDEPLAYPCIALAPMLLDGRGVPADPARAVKILEPLCATPNADACERLAEAHRDGRGAPADAAAARTLFAKACGHGSAAGCRSACDAGDAASCRYGARLFDTADGVALDNTAANAMYERAIRLDDASCSAGHAERCEALRKLYWEVRLFVFTDDALAQRFYARECTHEGSACFEAARLVERAGGSRERILELNGDGCDRGHIESCERAAQLDPSDPRYRERIPMLRRAQER